MLTFCRLRAVPAFYSGDRWKPDEVERFNEYRRNYHQFRRGAAFGAVGETSEIRAASIDGAASFAGAEAAARPQKKRKRRSQEEIKSSHRQVERRRTRRINNLIESLKTQLRVRAAPFAQCFRCSRTLR